MNIWILTVLSYVAQEYWKFLAWEDRQERFGYVNTQSISFSFLTLDTAQLPYKAQHKNLEKLNNAYRTSFITWKQQWKTTMSFTEGILRILNHRKEKEQERLEGLFLEPFIKLIVLFYLSICNQNCWNYLTRISWSE